LPVFSVFHLQKSVGWVKKWKKYRFCAFLQGKYKYIYTFLQEKTGAI
jgi:hypothetical protein